MDAYHPKRRITLSFAGRNGRDFIAVAFGGDASLRERLTQEPGLSQICICVNEIPIHIADTFNHYIKSPLDDILEEDDL